MHTSLARLSEAIRRNGIVPKSGIVSWSVLIRKFEWSAWISRKFNAYLELFPFFLGRSQWKLTASTIALRSFVVLVYFLLEFLIIDFNILHRSNHCIVPWSTWWNACCLMLCLCRYQVASSGLKVHAPARSDEYAQNFHR
jgi:hypothetical protein